MSDEALREAERAFAADKSAENEARLLVERVRAGKLSEERLRLLAYVGYPAAVLVRGGEVTAPTDEEAWLTGLVGFGREVCVRAALNVFPFSAACGSRTKWFVGDVFLAMGEPGAEFSSITLTNKGEHRGRIFTRNTRKDPGKDGGVCVSISACRPEPGARCLCFEMSLPETRAFEFVATGRRGIMTFNTHAGASDERFRELDKILIVDIRRALTLWAFSTD